MDDAGKAAAPAAARDLPGSVPPAPVGLAPGPLPPADSAAARRRWLAMPFVALGVAVIIVDATIVNVAVPTIIRELHLSATGAEWLNSIYALVFASLLISLGHAGDRIGRRRLFLLGIVAFVGASLVAATAPNGGVLVLGRLLQGVGGAMILPATLSTVNATFTGEERAIAFAIWGSTIGGFAAVGPLLGGWLTTDFSWRWAFIINLPIGVLVVVGILLFVPETRDPLTRRGVDWLGNLLAVVGFAGLTFALIEGSDYGWWSVTSRPEVAGLRWPTGLSPVPISLGLGAVALSGFAALEAARSRRGKVVLVDLGMLRIRSFGIGNLAVLVIALGEFGVLFVFPLFLQGVLGYSALATGALLTPLAAGTFVAGGATPQLARRVGALGVARIGLALEVVGLAGLGLAVGPTVGVWRMVPWLFVYGTGVGMATAQLTGVILTDIPVAVSGQGAGVQSTARQVGSALGIAVLGTLFLTGIGTRIRGDLAAAHGVSPGLAEQAVALVRGSGGAGIPALRGLPGGSRLVQVASDAVVSSTRTVAVVAAGFVLAGLAATALLPRQVERRRPE